MRALSLHQPWASGLAAGVKPEETRSWSTTYRGLVAIHAAKQWNRDQREAALRLLPDFEGFTALGGTGMVAAATWVQDPQAWPRGVVVGVGRLVDVVPIEQRTANPWGDFTPGRFAWLFEDLRPLTKPWRLCGRQGLWTVGAGDEAAILSLRAPKKASSARGVPSD